ncbi:hypothetical protein BST81_00945 [Leptolyngbya sp. 'hensonii']|uniref:STAS domain-containing protein n=1 Tax=Leptolyngbya sp. 'hensonii' TaxID=1922337 RepID=UPI00095035CC|nr:STAS domain-containing protein [Leptolyngbya sp. 'hensonii']OLP20335.1 hypothetical protein BST81_00945 [Leptolyngbya sp. 'hensonii']
MNASVAILRPSHILSSTSGGELLEQINHHLQAGKKAILIDFSDAMFMDSTGLGYLVTALSRIKAAQGELYLCSLKGQAAMLIELTKMDKTFQIFADRAAFDLYHSARNTSES